MTVKFFRQITKAHVFLLMMWIAIHVVPMPASAAIDATYSGSWFNAAQSGHGFFVQVTGDRVVLAWFVFDNNGNPHWLAGVGPISEKGFKISAIFVQGGQFPPNFDAAQTETIVWGEISFEFTDCDNATVSWIPQVPGFNPGSLAVIRLSSVEGLDCNGPQSNLKDLEELIQAVIGGHPNLFSGLTALAWERRAEGAADFLAGQVRGHHFPIALAELLASIGDAHTAITLDQIVDFHRLPISLHRVREGLVVSAADSEHLGLLGALVVGIEGIPIEDVEARLKRVISHENQHWADVRAESYVLIPEILEYLGVTSSLDTILVSVVGTGQTVSEVLLTTHLANEPVNLVGLFEESGLTPPLYLQRDDAYWFQYLPESKTVYMAYQQANEIPGYSFQQFIDDVVTLVGQQDVQRLVIDFRRNTGGNSRLAEPLGVALLLGPLQAFNTADRLFAIGGRRTFSSGLINWVQFGDQTNGTTIGMPSGGKPNHFGEVVSVVLSQSKIRVQHSTTFFTLIADNSIETFTPEIVVEEPTRAMFQDGRDPVLERILQ